jgi:hypothetical protein
MERGDALDIRAGPRIKVDGAQENTGGQNSQEAKTIRGRNATKKLLVWLVARLAQISPSLFFSYELHCDNKVIVVTAAVARIPTSSHFPFPFFLIGV